jgi:hypothetical protein
VIVTGGSQDNGTSFYTAAGGWKDWLGADGMECFIDKDNPSIMYGTVQFGRLYRTEDAASTIINLSEPGQGSGNWVTPFEKDPLAPNTIYVGYNRVHKSTSKGAAWTAISQDFGGDLENLKIAPSNNLVMYANNGSVLYKTIDGGGTDWQAMTAPGGSINAIAIHPSNPDKLAVVTTSSAKVRVSEDGGESWTSLTGSLPDFSALAIAWHDNGFNGLYLGMDYGLFYLDDTLSDWQPYNNNLPNVIVNELEINLEDSKIYAGTYGRGLWASDLVVPTLGNTDNNLFKKIRLFPNPATTSFTIGTDLIDQADVRIFDITGQLVMYQRQWMLDRPIPIDHLTPAVYFVRINTTKGVVTRKLVVN